MSSYAAAPCNDLCTQPNSSLISKTFHYQSVGPSSQHCWFLSAQQKYCLSQKLPVGDCLAGERTWHSIKPTNSGGTWGTCSHISWMLLTALFPDKVALHLVREHISLSVLYFLSLLPLLFTSGKPPSRNLVPIFPCGEYPLTVRTSGLIREEDIIKVLLLSLGNSPSPTLSSYVTTESYHRNKRLSAR